MDIGVIAESLKEVLVLREVRQGAEVYLGIVAGEEAGAGRGDKSLPDLPAQLPAHRDVLHIGVGGGKPAGSGAGLVKAGMDAAGLRVDQSRQGIDIGGLYLGKLAVLQDFADEGMNADAALPGRRPRWSNWFLPLRDVGNCISSKSTLPSCCGELILNSCLASS